MATLRALLVILFLLILPLSAQSKALTFTLKQAVEHALDANPSIEAKLLAIEKAQMDVLATGSYFLPRVTLMWNRGKLDNTGDIGTAEDFSNWSLSKGLRVQLSLFAGFAHLNSVGKALLQVSVEEARHDLAKLELIGNIQLHFLELLKAREDMKTVRDSKKRIDVQLKAARAFVDVGMAPQLNVLQNEVELSKVQQQEIRVTNTIRSSEAMLNKFLGYDPKVQIDYKGSLQEFNGTINYTEEEAIDMAMRNRPDLIIAHKSVALALKQSHITAGRYLPNVNAYYDNMRASKVYTDEKSAQKDYARSYWGAGVNVSWDVFDGGQTTFTYISDRKAAASLRKDYEDAMATARVSVIRSLLDVKAAKELITTSRKGMTAAKEGYDMANGRYQTSVGTITELLDAQVNLTQAEEDYSRALSEYHAARSRFFYNIGVENRGLQ